MTTLELALQELELDNSRVGTINYQGIAFFWNMEYKHTMRDLDRETRVIIHGLWLDNNLQLNGVSDLHYKLMCQGIDFIKGLRSY